MTMGDDFRGWASGCLMRLFGDGLSGDNEHGAAGSARVTGAGRGRTYGIPYTALFGSACDDAAYAGGVCFPLGPRSVAFDLECWGAGCSLIPLRY